MLSADFFQQLTSTDVISRYRYCGCQISQVVCHINPIARSCSSVFYTNCFCNQFFTFGRSQKRNIRSQRHTPHLFMVGCNSKGKIRQHKICSAHYNTHCIAVRIRNNQTAGGTTLSDFFNHSSVFDCESVAFKYLSYFFQRFLVFQYMNSKISPKAPALTVFKTAMATLIGVERSAPMICAAPNVRKLTTAISLKTFTAPLVCPNMFRQEYIKWVAL